MMGKGKGPQFDWISETFFAARTRSCAALGCFARLSFLLCVRCNQRKIQSKLRREIDELTGYSVGGSSMHAWGRELKAIGLGFLLCIHCVCLLSPQLDTDTRI